MPDAPPQMRANMAHAMTATTCVTLAQAANPWQTLASHENDRGCTSENFSMANGRMTGSVVCPTSRMTINGTFTATTYDVTTQAHSDRNGHVMDMEMHGVAHRVGECTGDEDTGGSDDDGGDAPATPESHGSK